MPEKTSILSHRFRTVADLNGDGTFTITDVGEWFKWIFLAPGDFLLIQLLNTEFGRFFEVSPASIGGKGSVAISVIAWLVTFVLLGWFALVLLEKNWALAEQKEATLAARKAEQEAQAQIERITPYLAEARELLGPDAEDDEVEAIADALADPDEEEVDEK